MDLLAVELMARTGRDPAEFYAESDRANSAPVYERIDAPATRGREGGAAHALTGVVKASELAGEPIRSHSHHGPRQRRRHWRPEGGHRERLVRRAALRDRGCLQAVRGKLPRPRPSAPHSSGCAGAHHRCVGRLHETRDTVGLKKRRAAAQSPTRRRLRLCRSVPVSAYQASHTVSRRRRPFVSRGGYGAQSVVECVEAGDDRFSFQRFPKSRSKALRTTNARERINRRPRELAVVYSVFYCALFHSRRAPSGP